MKLSALPLCMLFCLLSHYAFSQNSFQPGYVINLAGDSVHGLIRYEPWGSNPKVITFMDNSGEKAELSPHHIRRFHVAKRTFVSATVDVDDRNDNLTNLANDPEFSITKQSLFLEVLVEGNKSLLYYNDASGSPHFYIRRPMQVELLLFKPYLQGEGLNQTIAYRNEYHTQLASYLFDCPSVVNEITATTYTYNTLLELFSRYYSCRQSTPSIKKAKQRVNVSAGLMAGASLTKLNIYTEGERTYLGASNYPRSANFSGGIYGNVNLTRGLAIVNELFYTSYKTDAEAERYTSENDYSIVNTAFALSYVKIANQLAVNFNMGKSRLVFSGGLSNGFTVQRHNQKVHTIKYYNNEQTMSGPAIEQVRNMETGFICGLAMFVNRYSLHYRFEKGNGFSEAMRVGVRTTRNYLFAGYRLWNK